ncbi:hypothetical protein [Psychroserpens sp.]
MKKKSNIIFLYISLILICNTSIGYAQNQADGDKRFKKALKGMSGAYSKMYENAVLVQPDNPKTCKAESLIDVVDKKDLKISSSRLISGLIGMAGSLYPPNNYLLTGDYDKGEFLSQEDRAMNAASISSSFEEFITNFTGLNIADITASRLHPELGNKEVKDIDLLRRYYGSASSFIGGDWVEIESENMAEYGENSEFNVDLSPTKYVGNDDGKCAFYSKSKIRLKKYDYPMVIWEIRTEVFVDCVCKEEDNNSKVKKGVFVYSSIVKGLFTSTKETFEQPKNPIITIKSLECCPDKKEEPPKADLNEDAGINDLMPDQTIGFGAGVGFAQDFEETTFCFSAEYLYQINSNDEKGLYVGAEASYGNTSFGDFSSSDFRGGPKIQYNFSGVPSGETQFVAGIMANYAFGSNDNNGFKDDFTGIIACVYGGVNIRISEDWSIGGQFPIFIYESFTFKPEFGEDFEIDGTSLFINKNNPLKIVIRRRL